MPCCNKMFGHKHYMANALGHTAVSYDPLGSKFSVSNNRIASMPTFVGRGDTGGGDSVAGNSHNPVSNAQRDGAPSDMRTNAFQGKRKVVARLESKKKNKGE